MDEDSPRFCDVTSQLVKFEGQHIRYLIDENDTQWWRGQDVAAALGYKSTPHAISAHVPSKYKQMGAEIRLGDKYEEAAVYLNESGLYRLMYSSQLPEAKQLVMSYDGCITQYPRWWARRRLSNGRFVRGRLSGRQGLRHSQHGRAKSYLQDNGLVANQSATSTIPKNLSAPPPPLHAE